MTVRSLRAILDSADIEGLGPPRQCRCNGVRVTHPLVFPQQDSAVKRLLPAPPGPRCSFCRGALVDLFDAHLVLYDGPSLCYPGEPENLLAAYSHTKCGPDTGYNMQFARLLGDGVEDEPRSWTTHLLGKVWFCPTFAIEMREAHAAALYVRKALMEADKDEPAPMRSVTSMIPQRVPRAADNPRSISKTMRARVFERDDFRCRRCGHGPDVAPLVIDHVVPVARGGTGEFDNLQTLCRPCNAGKSDREPHAHDVRGAT